MPSAKLEGTKLSDILVQSNPGNKDPLRAVFDQNYSMVCSTIYRLVKNAATSEDLAQNVFMKMWTKREKIVINSSVGAYLRRMAYNEAISHLRKNKSRWEESVEDHQIEIPTASADEQIMGDELQAQINKAIDSLPPRCKAIFLLSRHEELSYKEIAQKLELSIKTVENQMGKALKMLRGAVGRT